MQKRLGRSVSDQSPILWRLSWVLQCGSPELNSPVYTHLYTWMEKGTLAVNCLALRIGGRTNRCGARRNNNLVHNTDDAPQYNNNSNRPKQKQCNIALRQLFSNSPTSSIQLPVMVVPWIKSLKTKSCFSTKCGVSAKMNLYKLSHNAFRSKQRNYLST